MSASSIDQAANDPQLRQRVQAMIYKIMSLDDAKAESDYGKRVRQGTVTLTPAFFAVAVETEAAYASAIAAGRGAPGHDSDVITDAQIESALNANWPADQPVVNPLAAPPL